MVAPIRDAGSTLLSLLDQILVFLPRVLSFAIILLIGYLVARIVRGLLVKGLRAVRFDTLADRAGVGHFLEVARIRLDATHVLALIVFWWIFLAFISLAVESLGLTTLTNFTNSVLAYIPNLAVAALILIVGALLANLLGDVVRGAASNAGLTTAALIGGIARWAVLVFAFMATLTQLNVAQNMILILFTALVGMLAIAGGLAFGLGGVETARGLIAGWAMGRMLQPGQRVRIGNRAGTVVRHDLSTTVVDVGGGQISIPNAELAHEEITMLGGESMPPRTPAGAA
ncbi:MAG: hypothetical protein OJF49_003765 [Ktedonobacterales bacterium]|jgi:hypothetical protein|nr:MAG: hypothetical protein OJF49_003765 [Ktedonobacterales bacterium]